MTIRIFNPNPVLGPSGFVFVPENGVRVSKFEIGYPEMRVVSDPRPDMHGTVDYTQFFGASSVSIEFRIWPEWANFHTTRRAIMDTLRGLCNPALNPYLYENIDGQLERRTKIKCDQNSMPFERPDDVEVQMQFRCPDGLWESSDQATYQCGPAVAPGVTPGRTYPLNFPRTYPAAAPVGGTLVTQQGNVESYPELIVYGPCTNVRVSNVTQGRFIQLNNVNLSASDYLFISMRNRTISMNGDINQDLYDKGDWSISEWWSISPGQNQIGFVPDGYADTTKMQVQFRHNWI